MLVFPSPTWSMSTSFVFPYEFQAYSIDSSIDVITSDRSNSNFLCILGVHVKKKKMKVGIFLNLLGG